MKAFVTFRTALFNHTDVRPHFINPCCFGEDAVEWLRTRLRALPHEVSEPIQEDYGWGLWIGSGRDTFWVWASTFDAECGEAVAAWGIGIAYDPGLNLVARLFHTPSARLHAAVCSEVDRALRAEARISEVEWWDDGFYTGLGRQHPIPG